uniref:Uncharacterized protein n=1 Tax=viral metagenome TaxID=1070528 RepID=A0A6C0BF70_9ZZZZ
MAGNRINAGQLLHQLRKNVWSHHDTRIILNNMLDFVTNGSNFTSEMIRTFNTKIRVNSRSLYEEPSILNKIIQLLNLGHKILDQETSIIIILYNQDTIGTIMNTYNFEIDEIFISYFNRTDNYAANIYKTIFELCSIKIVNNEKIFENYLNPFIVNYLIEHRHLVIEQNIIHKIITLYDESVLEKALRYGGTLDNSLLETCCGSSNICMYNIIKFLFSNSILPTHTSFEKLINNKNINYYLDINAKLFLKYGYNLTYEQLLKLTSKKIKIDNIEKYGIKLDDNYLKVCDKINFYPYPFDDIEQSDIELMNICYPHRNKYIIKQGIIPKQRCMRLACSYKNNLSTIETLIESGGKIDIECLQKTIELHTSNRQVTLIFEKFRETLLNDYKLIDKNIVVKKKEVLEKKEEVLEKKEDVLEKKEEIVISLIPIDFDIYNNIYDIISTDIKTILGITKKELNYVDFRRFVMNYVNDNNCVKSEFITVPNELNYNKNNEITIKYIDNWIYSLLKYKNKSTENVENIENLENLENVVVKRVRKTRILKKN